MTATTTNYPTARLESFFARAERWLDDRGKFAWIGAIILGFIAVWPVGLALLAYVVFFKKSNKRGTAAFARATISMRASSGTCMKRFSKIVSFSTLVPSALASSAISCACMSVARPG
jgi:hypothetical protein